VLAAGVCAGNYFDKEDSSGLYRDAFELAGAERSRVTSRRGPPLRADGSAG